MSKLYFHSEYTKDIKHILNYLVYAGEKLEAQEVILSTGEIMSINVDEIIDFTKYPDVQSVQIRTKSGRDVSFTPNEYNLLIKQDKEIEHMTPKGYIDYIAERPGAVKDEIGGLFTINGSISTEKALEIAEQYPNNTWWINIVSLKREDAERVGFDNRESFEDLIRSKIPDICKNYNISMENLIIYGAYHDKINNPHVHLFFTSKDNREGFIRDLTKSSYNMKRDYFNIIYKDDMKILYQEKDTHKKELNTALENSIKRLSAKSYVTEKQVLQSFVDLSNALKTEKGKLQYGYLSKENKRLVDTLLIDIINRDKEVNKCFKECMHTQEKFLRNYTSDEETIKNKLDDYKVKLLMPYSKQKDNVLQNIIVKNVANYNKKSFNMLNENNMDSVTFSFLSNNDHKFMYKLGKNYLYKENNPELAEDYLFNSFMINKDRYTAFELGTALNKLNDKDTAREYFNEYKSMTDEQSIKHPYEFYTLSKYYEFYKEDFKDLSQYKDKVVLENLTDDLISKKEQEYSLNEYLNLKVSANMGYIPAIQKIKNISPIQLTDNMNFDYSIHNNNPYIMTELKEVIKSSNIDNKDNTIYNLSKNIVNKITYHSEKQQEKVKLRFDEKIMLAKSYLDLYKTSKETYLSNNILDNEKDYNHFSNSQYSQFYLITYDNIIKDEDKQDEKIDFAIYLLKQGEKTIANDIFKNILSEKINLNKIIDLTKNDNQLKKDILTYFSEQGNQQAMYYLGKFYLYSEEYQDIQKATELLEKAVAKEHLYATLTLGNYYLLSEDENLVQRGIDLLSPLAKDNEQAMFYLGKFYLYSEDEQLISQGADLLENAVAKEHIYATITLGNHYLSSDDDNLVQRGIDLLSPLAEDNEQAMYYLGKFYLYSEEYQDIQKATELLEKAVAKEHLYATLTLGNHYLLSDDDNLVQRGIDLLSPLAEDNEQAMYYLGKFYLYNETHQDTQKAVDLLENAVAKEHIYATLTLGNYYLSSEDENLVQRGIDLLSPLAEDNEQAMFYLGKFYLYSEDEQLISQGVDLLENAVAKEHLYATITLGNHYLSSDDANLVQRGIDLLSPLAEDNEQAMYYLGKFYLYNETHQDTQKAVDLLENAVAKEHIYATLTLGNYYLLSEDENLVQRGIDLLSPLAEDNEQAMYYFGKFYLYSEEYQDIQKATELLEKAVAKEHIYATITLGNYYLSSEDENLVQRGIDLLSPLAEDNEQAMYYLGKFYLYNETHQDTQKAVDLLENAVAKEHLYATITLGNYYLSSEDENLVQRGIDLLSPLTEDNEQAMYYLGKFYLYSEEYQDIQKATELLEKAVTKEHIYATLMLSNHYLSSDDENLVQRGIDLLSPLTEDNEQAMFYLGKFYLYSEEHQDIQKATELLENAVTKEHLYATLMLGNHYLSSDDENLMQRGIDLLSPLTEDNEQAMFYLGRFYLYNETYQDTQKAVYLLEKAVEKNHLYATLTLGNYYLSSEDNNLVQRGIDLLSPLAKDNEQAMYYLGKFYLYSEEYQDIQKGIDLLEKSLDKGQIYAKLPLTKYYINNNIQKGYKYLNDLKHSDDEYLRTSANRISSRIEIDRGNLKSAEKDLLNVYHSKYVTNMDIYNLAHIYDKMGNEKSANIYYTQALEGFKKESTPINNYMLGIMYLTGRGCEKDTVKAKEYFKLADKQGHPNSREMIASINKQTIYACNHLLQAIAYNLMTVANQNYDYNKNLNKHKSKNNFRKPKVYRISKIQENAVQKTKENNHDYSIGY